MEISTLKMDKFTAKRPGLNCPLVNDQLILNRLSILDTLYEQGSITYKALVRQLRTLNHYLALHDSRVRVALTNTNTNNGIKILDTPQLLRKYHHLKREYNIMTHEQALQKTLALWHKIVAEHDDDTKPEVKTARYMIILINKQLSDLCNS